MLSTMAATEDGSSLALANIALSLACDSGMPAASAAPRPRRPTGIGSAGLAMISTLGAAEAGSGGLLRNAVETSPCGGSLVMLADLPKDDALAEVPRPGVGGTLDELPVCGEAAFANEAGDKSRCSRKTLLSLECFGRETFDFCPSGVRRESSEQTRGKGELPLLRCLPCCAAGSVSGGSVMYPGVNGSDTSKLRVGGALLTPLLVCLVSMRLRRRRLPLRDCPRLSPRDSVLRLTAPGSEQRDSSPVRCFIAWNSSMVRDGSLFGGAKGLSLLSESPVVGDASPPKGNLLASSEGFRLGSNGGDPARNSLASE
mmetsp:Transcript_123688/g.219199  ORF Transcript_123688/g.219199 Transcript_123688/m.219199 type:complete len:314 (-) Transcript_123688:92-1033(-)